MRYISTNEVKDHLELDVLNDTDDPKLGVVKNWVNGSEAEVDNLTSSRWDLHKIDNELISPDSQTQDFILSTRPLKRITSLEYQNGDEWTEAWVTIADTDYRIVNPRISKIRTKDYYWKVEGLRVSYEAGYENIPVWLKELTLLLVEKRYVMSRLGIAAADPETVSVAVIRITDKSNASLKYRLEGLEREIQDRLKQLGKSMKSSNFQIGYVNMYSAPVKRYRF